MSYPKPWLNDLAFGNGIYVAAANGGVLTSEDASTWTMSPAFTSERLVRVLLAGGRFVAFGDGGSVFRSDNGIDWSSTAKVLPELLVDVIHTGTRFVVRLQNSIWTSEDGVTWTSRFQGGDMTSIRAPVKIIRAGGKIFMLSENGILESADGLAWTSVAKPAEAGGKVPYAVSYGNGVFVLLIGFPKWDPLYGSPFVPPGSLIYTSMDGITWTQRFASDTEIFNAIRFLNGQFVAVGQNDALRTSADGVTWTAGSASTVSQPESIIDFNGRFFGYIIGGIATSTDGISWSTIATGVDTSHSLLSLTKLNGRLFAVYSDGVASSADGVTWKFTETFGPLYGYSGVVFANGMFVAVGGGLTVQNSFPSVGDATPKGWILTSPDGLRWTLRAKGPDLSLQSVAYGGGRFVAVGGRSAANPSSSTIMTSEDGIHWTRITAPSNTMFSQVIYGGGQFMVIGNDLVTTADNPILHYQGSVIGSVDGVNWTTRMQPIDGEVHGTAYGKGRFVITASLLQDKGDYQSIAYSSTDGASWVSTASPYSLFAGVAFANGVFVSGGGKDLLSSADGAQWTPHPAGDVFLTKVIAAEGNFLAFFAANDMERLYMTSKDGAQWTSHFLTQYAFGGLGSITSAVYGQSKWLISGSTQYPYISP